jgi:hypothetical protein
MVSYMMLCAIYVHFIMRARVREREKGKRERERAYARELDAPGNSAWHSVEE